MYTLLSALMYTVPWGNFRRWCLQCPKGTYRFILSSGLWCILCPEGISDGDVYSAPREHTDLYYPQASDVYCALREFQTVMFTVPQGNIQIYTILRPLMYTVPRGNFRWWCLQCPEGTYRFILSSGLWCILCPEGISDDVYGAPREHTDLYYPQASDVYCAPREFQMVMFTVPRGNIQIYTVPSPLMYTVPWGNFRRWCLQCPDGTYRFVLSSGLWCILCPEGITLCLQCPEGTYRFILSLVFWCILMYTVPWGNFRRWCLQCPKGTYIFILFSVLWCILMNFRRSCLQCPAGTFRFILSSVLWCILCPEGSQYSDLYSALKELKCTDVYGAMGELCPVGTSMYLNHSCMIYFRKPLWLGSGYHPWVGSGWKGWGVENSEWDISLCKKHREIGTAWEWQR